jgi:hypothetical protein
MDIVPSQMRLDEGVAFGIERHGADMLRSCFGGEAGLYPNPDAWAKTAVPYLLGLGPADNGQSLTVGDR